MEAQHYISAASKTFLV